VVIVVRDVLTDPRFVECVCRCGTFVSVAVLLSSCLRNLHGRFQVVLPLRRVPSVYVFVRTCVRARAGAVAAVGLSQSCFHVPLCCTLLLLGRCRASTYSSNAPLSSSPLLVFKHLPVTHRWASDGSVGPSSHSSSLCVGTLALLAGDRRVVLSRESSAAQQNGCAVPCCHPLFIPVVV